MATISHEVADYRKKDGTYAIRIRLIHNRKAIRKPSGIFTGAITKYIQSIFKVYSKYIQSRYKVDKTGKVGVGCVQVVFLLGRHEHGGLVRFEEVRPSGRGADKVTDIYIKKDFSRIWEANRKVLDLLK